MSDPALTHLDGTGSARMVDVGEKAATARRARARARVRMSPQTAAAVAAGNAPKGEVLGTARLAGIQAAKQTAALIPLAHPLALAFVDVTARVDVEEGLVELVSEASVAAQTGVEMEAMVACSVAALTVYDMVKGLERGVSIEQVVLLEKTGGRSDWRLQEESPLSAAPLRVGILTVSTSRATGSGGDESGDRLELLARDLGGEIAAREIVSDEQPLIEERLRRYCDEAGCALVLTTGGTGVAPRDVTPEATLAVVERQVPGIAEAMRLASKEHTRHWMLSRAVAGIRGRTLIVNFPGNPRSIAQTAAAVSSALPHALSLLADAPTEH